MSTRADYRVVTVTDGTAFLIDLHDSFSNPTMSVTNDAEAVVAAVLRNYPWAARIVYRDTEGEWAELRHDGFSVFKGFGPWTGWTPDV